MTRARALLPALLLPALLPVAPATAAPAGQASPTRGPAALSKASTMTQLKCADDPVSRSVCMIRIILDDVQAVAGGLGGGGVSEIKALSSTSYRVSLPREQRVRQLTYEFAVEAGAVRLTGRTEGARTPGPSRSQP